MPPAPPPQPNSINNTSVQVPIPISYNPQYRQQQIEKRIVQSNQSENEVQGASAEDQIKSAYIRTYGSRLGFEYYQLDVLERKLKSAEATNASNKKINEIKSDIANQSRNIRSAQVSQSTGGGTKLKGQGITTTIKKESGTVIIEKGKTTGYLPTGGYSPVGSTVPSEKFFLQSSSQQSQQQMIGGFSKAPKVQSEVIVPATGIIAGGEVKKIGKNYYEEAKISSQVLPITTPASSLESQTYYDFPKPKKIEKLAPRQNEKNYSEQRFGPRMFTPKTDPFQKEGKLTKPAKEIRNKTINFLSEQELKIERGGQSLKGISKNFNLIEGYTDVPSGNIEFAIGFAQAPFQTAEFFLEPEKTVEIAKSLFKIEYRKTPSGERIPQLVPEEKNVAKIPESILKNPEKFLGSIAGSAIFDPIITIPALTFATKPIVNISSQIKLAKLGIESGVVEGSPTTSFFRTKEKLGFLLVEDIHAKNPIISGVGDLELKELLQQTKAGTGKPIITGSFVQGALSEGKIGDEFLIRQFEEHYGGHRSSGLFASPELKLQNDIPIILAGGERVVLKSGETVGIGAKQFASDLVRSEYNAKISLQPFSPKNTLLVGRESILLPKTKNLSNIEISRNFYKDDFSGQFAIAPQEILPKELPTAMEREVLAQAQRVFPYETRGTIVNLTSIKNLEKQLTFPIFTDKPFFRTLFTNLADKTPSVITYRPFISTNKIKNTFIDLSTRFDNFDRFYSFLGFSRDFKDITVSGITLTAPLGPKINLPTYAERPRVGAIIRKPFTEKILFVREGNQPLLFPGGGVEPINIKSTVGKEGIRIGYPIDYRNDLAREVYEETGLQLKSLSKKPFLEDIRSTPHPLNPFIGSKKQGTLQPAYIFQDVSKVYEASPIFFNPRPKGEISEIRLLTPEEALSRSDIGSIERQTLETIVKEPFRPGSKVIGFDLDETLVFRSNGKYIPRARIKETLATLRNKGFELDVFTHSRRARAVKVLKETGLDNYFDRIISRELYAKGRSESTLKDIRKFGIELLVENRPQQVRSLQKRGLKSVLVPEKQSIPIDSKMLIKNLENDIVSPRIITSDDYRISRKIISLDRELPRFSRNFLPPQYSKRDYSIRENRVSYSYRSFRPLERKIESSSRYVQLREPVNYRKESERKIVDIRRLPYNYEPIKPNEYRKNRIIETRRPEGPPRIISEPRPRPYPRLVPEFNSDIKYNKRTRSDDLYRRNIGPSFRVQYRSRGKVRTLEGEFSQRDAIAVGTNLVGKTLRASFRTIKGTGVAIERGIKAIPIQSYVSKRGFTVQKRGTRLSSLGERQEIQSARRMKRGRLF